MAYIINILDLSEWSVWFAGQKYMKPDTRTVKDWCVSQGADIAWNLGMFNPNGLGIAFVRTKNGDSGYGGASDTLVIDEANQCKGYSNGIVSGIVSINAPHDKAARTRCGVGLTFSGKVIIAQTSHGVTEKAFVTKVNSFVQSRGERVKLFVLEDGGGSTSQYSAISRLSFYPEGTRKVATVICAGRCRRAPITRVLRLWCKGEDVRLLQTVLGGIECDGSYGFGTRSRVIAAQKALGLTPDGVCGPLTQKALGLRF